MSFGDLINLIEALYKAIEQDPMSFMVVYPMAIMTSSMLVYALIQDLIPVYRTRLAHAIGYRAEKTQVVSTTKRNYKTGKQIQFSS
jgi:hypothetical protein